MKRFLLAALLALTIHGLFFGFVPKPVEKKSPKIPHTVTISLVSYHPVKPKPVAKPPRIPQERPSQRPPEKKQDTVIRPLPTIKSVMVPPEILEPKKEAFKHPEKTVRPQKQIKPLKSVARPPKKPAKPKTKPKAPPVKTVTASPAPEKKMVPVVTPPSAQASVTPKKDAAPPIEETIGVEETVKPLSYTPEDSEAEKGTKIASIPPVKVVREARPAYKDNPRPQYPKRARRRGYEGTVVLEVLVDRSGRVKELRILTSSGHRVLDRAALKSVNGWLFEPGMVGDEKADMWVRVPVRFELRGG